MPAKSGIPPPSLYRHSGSHSRGSWWASAAMAAMTCGTRSAGVGLGSATRTTQMVASGCVFTATYAYAVGVTLALAGCTILAQPPSLGHSGSKAWAVRPPSPGWKEITDYASQHMGPISAAVAARKAQVAEKFGDALTLKHPRKPWQALGDITEAPSTVPQQPVRGQWSCKGRPHRTVLE